VVTISGPLPPDILDEQERDFDGPVSVPEIEPGSGHGLGCLVLYLVEMRATVGLKPRFDTLRASFTMLILENSGRLVMVFPRQSPRKAKATSSSDSRFRAAACAASMDAIIGSLAARSRISRDSCCHVGVDRRRSSQLLAT
jgi:hypothetical protein